MPLIGRLIIRRIGLAIPVALGASFLSFLLVNLLPGTVVLTILGQGASASAVAHLNHQLGFDRPFPVRYVVWLGHTVRGDLGTSLTWHASVTSLLAQRVPVTLELVVIGIVLALVPAIALSCLAARRPGGAVDRALSVGSILGLSVPNFLIALGLIFLLAVKVRMLPALGFVPLGTSVPKNLRSMVLPGLTMAIGLFATYARVLKSDMLDQVLNEEYVNAARTKGTPEWRIVVRHVLRNASFSLVTIVALNLGVLLGTTVIVEQIFALPGVGQLLVSGVNERDQPVVLGIVLCLSVAVIVMNLLADIAYALLDPRVRHGAA